MSTGVVPAGKVHSNGIALLLLDYVGIVKMYANLVFKPAARNCRRYILQSRVFLIDVTSYCSGRSSIVA